MMIQLTELNRIKPSAKHDILMILIVLVFGFVNLFWGEVIAVDGGFGWDGKVYRAIARDFRGKVLNDILPPYRLQRIVPSGIVHYSLRMLHIRRTDESILMGFRVLNLGSIVLAAYLYVLISGEMQFNTTGKWIGFFGLFVNVANSKHYFYYPTLTDQFAFMLAMLMLYFFFKNSRLGLLIVTIAGSFTWPLLHYYGLLLYIFPKKTDEKFEKSSRLACFVSASATCVLLFLITWVHIVKKSAVPGGAMQVVESVFYLSVICTLAYFFFGLKVALDNIGIPDAQSIARSTSAGRLVVGFLVVILVKGFLFLFAGAPIPSNPSPYGYVQLVALESIVRPLSFYIAHVVYFGPILLLTLFLWKPLTRTISRYGIGLSLLVLCNFALSIESESRHLIAALPFFVIFTVKVAEELSWSPPYLWFTGIVSILYSKIWLLMNRVPLTGDLLQFPFQYYLMNLGPWMSNQMYVTQGIFVLLTGIIIFVLVKPQVFENI